MYVDKVFCPEAGPSLDVHHKGSKYLQGRLAHKGQMGQARPKNFR